MPLAWRSDSVAPRAGSTAGLEVVRKLPQSKADRKPAGAQRTNVEEFPEVTKEPGAFAHGAQLLLLWLTKERENKGQSADRSDQRLAGVDPVVDEGGAAIPVPLYSAAVSDAPPPPPPRGHERRPEIAGASPRVDRLAYAALVMGILSLVSSVVLLGSGILLGPVAAIFHRSRARCSKSTVRSSRSTGRSRYFHPAASCKRRTGRCFRRTCPLMRSKGYCAADRSHQAECQVASGRGSEPRRRTSPVCR